jgi:hypothetical protein
MWLLEAVGTAANPADAGLDLILVDAMHVAIAAPVKHVRIDLIGTVEPLGGVKPPAAHPDPQTPVGQGLPVFDGAVAAGKMQPAGVASPSRVNPSAWIRGCDLR